MTEEQIKQLISKIEELNIACYREGFDKCAAINNGDTKKVIELSLNSESMKIHKEVIEFIYENN